VGDHPRTRGQRVTVFLTTQNLEEADKLADRIALLDHGRLVAEGTPAELKRRIPGGHARLTFSERVDAAVRVLGEAPGNNDGLVLRVPNDGTPESLMALLGRLHHRGVCIDQVTVDTPDLDDVFVALTGHAEKGQVDPR
jgi:ABC-2 type transport system ATP-binding protein